VEEKEQLAADLTDLRARGDDVRQTLEIKIEDLEMLVSTSAPYLQYARNLECTTNQITSLLCTWTSALA
jgi:hypothetical protein